MSHFHCIIIGIWFRSYLNGLVLFHTFCNLNLNLAIRSSWSEPQSAPGLFFCWLYRASPSLAAENIISLISVLTIWWCPCVESSLVLLEKGVCYDQCIRLAKLCESLPCFILYSKAKLACYSRCLLTFYLCIQSSMMKRTSFFGISSRRSCRSLYSRSTSASLALVVGA